MDATEHAFPREVGGDSEMSASAGDVRVRNKRKNVAIEWYMDEVSSSWRDERPARSSEAEVLVRTK